jgi:hypothetical protein
MGWVPLLWKDEVRGRKKRTKTHPHVVVRLERLRQPSRQRLVAAAPPLAHAAVAAAQRRQQGAHPAFPSVRGDECAEEVKRDKMRSPAMRVVGRDQGVRES